MKIGNNLEVLTILKSDFIFGLPLNDKFFILKQAVKLKKDFPCCHNF